MNRHLKHRRAGVTLVELMLAAGIVAATMTAIFSAAMTVTTINQTNTTRMESTLAVSSLMEELARLNHDQLEDYSLPEVDLPGIWSVVIVTALWDNDDGYRSGTYLALNLDGEQDLLDEMEYYPDLPDDKQVELFVRIYWTDEDNRHYWTSSSVMAKG